MVSKTSLLPLVKAYDWRAVDAGLKEKPSLVQYRDDKQRNWLHILCATELKGRNPADSVRTADVLLFHGLDIQSHAFGEGEWKATPVWYCVAHGRNLILAEHLLKLGASPHYSFFAAAWNDDIEAIDLLARYGGDIEDKANPSETPFLGAIGWSRFRAAERLAHHGADIQAKDAKGRNALHMMLDKGSDYEAIESIAALGVRADIAGPDGETAIARMQRKKDPRFRALAERLAR